MFIILNGVRQLLTLARWLAYLLVLLIYSMFTAQAKQNFQNNANFIKLHLNKKDLYMFEAQKHCIAVNRNI